MNEQPPVTNDDLPKIRRYPVYNFNPDMEARSQTDQDLGPFFGAFAEYMIKDGKTRRSGSLDGMGDSGYSNEIHDFLRPLAAFEQYASRFP